MEAIKRSASLLKKTWGEQIIGSAGIGLVLGLIGLAIAVIGIALGTVIIGAGAAHLGIAGIVITILAIVVIAMIGATLRGIYSAALHQYAVGGETDVFGDEVLAGAFRPERLRAPFGR